MPTDILKSALHAALACIFLTMSGCAGLPKCTDAFTVDESAGRVVVYRKAAVMGFAVRHPVAIDNCQFGTLTNGGFIVGQLPPGDYQIAVLNDFGKPRNPQRINVRSGEDMYLRWSFDVEDVYVVGSTSGATGRDVFTPVTREIAVSELEKLGELN